MKCDMGHNLGHVERLLRIGLGLALLAIAGLTALSWWGTAVFLVVGIVALVTGILGFCPAWRILGINTSHETHENQVKES